MLKKKKKPQDNSSHLTKGVARPTVTALQDRTSLISVTPGSPWRAPCRLLDWNTPPALSGPRSHFFSANFSLKHIHNNLHVTQQWNSSQILKRWAAEVTVAPSPAQPGWLTLTLWVSPHSCRILCLHVYTRASKGREEMRAKKFHRSTACTSQPVVMQERGWAVSRRSR